MKHQLCQIRVEFRDIRPLIWRQLLASSDVPLRTYTGFYGVRWEGKTRMDCGRPPGYEEVLKATANPKSKLYAELGEWIGPKFDPQAFSSDNANRESLHGDDDPSW